MKPRCCFSVNNFWIIFILQFSVTFISDSSVAARLDTVPTLPIHYKFNCSSNGKKYSLKPFISSFFQFIYVDNTTSKCEPSANQSVDCGSKSSANFSCVRVSPSADHNGDGEDVTLFTTRPRTFQDCSFLIHGFLHYIGSRLDCHIENVHLTLNFETGIVLNVLQ